MSRARTPYPRKGELPAWLETLGWLITMWQTRRARMWMTWEERRIFDKAAFSETPSVFDITPDDVHRGIDAVESWRDFVR